MTTILYHMMYSHGFFVFFYYLPASLQYLLQSSWYWESTGWLEVVKDSSLLWFPSLSCKWTLVKDAIVELMLYSGSASILILKWLFLILLGEVWLYTEGCPLEYCSWAGVSSFLLSRAIKTQYPPTKNKMHSTSWYLAIFFSLYPVTDLYHKNLTNSYSSAYSP